MVHFPSRATGVELRRMAHRPDVRDLFATGVARLSDTRFRVPAHWPRAHRFFGPVAGHQDPLLIAETMRQAAILVCHAELGVPLGDAFVMWELRYTTAAGHLVLGGGPWDVMVEVNCSDIRRRGSGLGSMRVGFVLRRDGAVLAVCGSRISCTSAAAYRRLRGHRPTAAAPPPPALAPRTVGRTAERDVVLAPPAAPGRWQLRLDTGHPTLFGRPNDHVPGILLLEAARQAANATVPGFLPVTLRSDFLRYVELDRPCWIEAATAPAGVLVRAVQDGETVFTCALGGPD
ncbi:ScbA protein [Streptomyces drozdowiczii]|uniref:ScbA protein n=2 Tax=Streptomyces drozdowiczii TaxID=202862 RepID=A0ABY6PWH9_9ACTN|nr:ScbA/BarX family gamma-butyrolactone biosynthesis protein [Streptomyces drozdowiczii]UZK56518.1 ScbA protein [Streptomyces drozdowiczii]